MVDIKNIMRIADDFRGRLVRARTRHVHSTINANRDWKIILAVFALANAASIAFSAYLFLEIRRGEIFLVEPPASFRADTLDRALLSETLFHYSEQVRKHEALLTTPPTLADPSRER